MSADEGQGGDVIPLITRARHREHLERALLHLDTFLSYGTRRVLTFHSFLGRTLTKLH